MSHFRDQCPQCGRWLSNSGECRAHGPVGISAILSAPLTEDSVSAFMKITTRRIHELTGISEIRRDARKRAKYEVPGPPMSLEDAHKLIEDACKEFAHGLEDFQIVK